MVNALPVVAVVGAATMKLVATPGETMMALLLMDTVSTVAVSVQPADVAVSSVTTAAP